MNLVDDSLELVHRDRVSNETYCQGVGQPDHDISPKEEAWEEYGCILWDLAASKTHEELMVENLLLEVLSANLMIQQSVHATEINLGIIGNLACHEVPMRHIISTNELIELIVNQLFLDDAQCLCEAFWQSILDVILRAIEAISIMDGHSQEISSNKELFHLISELVKFQDRVEIANSCVIVAVVIANILSDVEYLALKMSHGRLLPLSQARVYL